MKKMTINEIAEIANVSKGTVSKILNNRPGVGEKTRERVMSLVKQFDFTPDSSAQALAFSKTFNIGLIVPHVAEVSLNGAYWSAIISAVTQTATDNNYNLMLFTPKSEDSLLDVFDAILKSNKVDGLVIGAEHFDLACKDKLDMREVPYVLIGNHSGLSTYSVDVDNRQAAGDMTKYLIDRGFRNIAFICGPKDRFYSRLRIEGFEREASNKGFIHSIAPVADYEKAEVIKTVQQVMSSATPPDALFLGAGGQFFFDALLALRDMERDFDGIGIAVFDDYPFLDYVIPPVTAIKQPLREMGERAAEMLLQLIKGDIVNEPSIILETSIIIRKN